MNLIMNTSDKDKNPKKRGRKPKPEAESDAGIAKLLTLPAEVWDLLKQLAKRRLSNVTAEIRNAIRERLEKHDLWPKNPSEGE